MQSSGVTTVHVRGKRGKMEVLAYSKTARGQSFIKRRHLTSATSIGNEDFKSKMASAVEEVLSVQQEMFE